MEYKKYKAIEEYFKLGEVIEKDLEKLNALNRIKEGLISIKNISLLQKELSSLGCSGIDCLVIKELYEALVDEINHLTEAREDLKEIAAGYNIDMNQIVIEKQFYDIEKAIQQF